VPVPLSASRKLYQNAEKHNKSAAHMAAVAASQIAGPSVVTKLIVASNESMLRDGQMMKLCFRAAYFMFISEIPHTTHWRDLLSTVAACDSSGHLAKYFARCPANAHHLSTAAISSILEAFEEEMCTRLREKLAAVTEYAVMADECTDVHRVEKVSICVRLLASSEVQEVFLGCWPVQSTKAIDIHKCIIDNLAKFGLAPEQIVAASFDDASNMSGEHAGVQALLKKSSPSLIFVHCSSHLLQFALVRAANTVVEIKRVLNLLSKLYAFFSHSPFRLNIFKHTLEAVDGMCHKLVQPGIQGGCHTRAVSRLC